MFIKMSYFTDMVIPDIYDIDSDTGMTQKTFNRTIKHNKTIINVTFI